MDFSIIVPTFNRPDQLRACLHALGELDYAPDRFEIIVVDDGGHVDLTRLAAPPALQQRLHWIRQANKGPAAARNQGALEARGRWLAFTDDDCRPNRRWLTELADALAGGEDWLVGGHTSNRLRENLCSEVSQLIVDAVYAYFNRDDTRARFVASNNMAVWREAFLAIGGFDETFRPASEDRELCDRWLWLGRRILWVDGAHVEHDNALTLIGFLRQHFSYGRGAFRFHRRRRSRGAGVLHQDLGFYASARSLLVKPALASARPWATLGLLAAWQVANALGFFAELVRSFPVPGSAHGSANHIT
jgi:glycosyltransferase involved in cell wall biosynthesis